MCCLPEKTYTVTVLVTIRHLWGEYTNVFLLEDLQLMAPTSESSHDWDQCLSRETTTVQPVTTITRVYISSTIYNFSIIVKH